jgi:hypothetical protein
MIIHTDSDNPKPIEQKVCELILKKLYVKVDETQIFIDKEIVISLILKDIITVAKADCDIEKALKIAIKEQPQYKTAPDSKRAEISQAAEEFAIEVEAYRYYLDLKKDHADDLEIYDAVLMTLNSDEELLTKRLLEIISEAIGLFITEEVAIAKRTSRDQLISTYAYHVKMIASNDTIEDAVEEFYYTNEEFFIKNHLKKASIKQELDQTNTVFKDEISAYKLALSMQTQNMEIPMILGMVKQLLKLDQT